MVKNNKSKEIVIKKDTVIIDKKFYLSQSIISRMESSSRRCELAILRLSGRVPTANNIQITSLSGILHNFRSDRFLSCKTHQFKGHDPKPR